RNQLVGWRRVFQRAEPFEIKRTLAGGDPVSGEQAPAEDDMRAEGDADPSRVPGCCRERCGEIDQGDEAEKRDEQGTAASRMALPKGHGRVLPAGLVLVKDLQVTPYTLHPRV